jgi:hypothetical protein
LRDVETGVSLNHRRSFVRARGATVRIRNEGREARLESGNSGITRHYERRKIGFELGISGGAIHDLVNSSRNGSTVVSANVALHARAACAALATLATCTAGRTTSATAAARRIITTTHCNESREHCAAQKL